MDALKHKYFTCTNLRFTLYEFTHNKFIFHDDPNQCSLLHTVLFLSLISVTSLPNLTVLWSVVLIHIPEVPGSNFDRQREHFERMVPWFSLVTRENARISAHIAMTSPFHTFVQFPYLVNILLSYDLVWTTACVSRWAIRHETAIISRVTLIVQKETWNLSEVDTEYFGFKTSICRENVGYMYLAVNSMSSHKGSWSR
jgi:hypothetical protein